MKQGYSFLWLLLPVTVLFALAGSMVYERSGMEYEITYPPLQMLPQAKIEVENYFTEKQADTLVIYDSDGFTGEEHIRTVLATLDNMRVKYDIFDVSSDSDFDLKKYDYVIISFLEIEKLEGKIFAIVNWVEDGGRVLFSIRPDPSYIFNSIYRQMGIISKGDDFVEAKGVKFSTNLLPGSNGMSIGEDFILHSSHPVELSNECLVHVTSADEFETPILWECPYRQGRFVVINSDQFNTKSDRGILGAAYSLLHDVIVYPVINASVFFIDDFPSPIPEGTDESITEQFGRDIQNYFINVWWPDLHQISREFGIRYTGVIIETYNDYVNPPFVKQPEIERHQYFGGLVLNNGGEIGLHGYNHVPLCLESAQVNQVLDYPGWPSTEAMELSIYELYSFTQKLFPDIKLRTYVPASNILCPDARQWLPKALPELQVIASVYLPDEEGMAYEQEFEEAEDGIIEFPRIIAGYDISDYMRWAALNELGLHYVNTHFVHPDDVLSGDRGAEKGWSYLLSRFRDYVTWLSEAAPGLRNSTAIEGAMAVQRYSRLAVQTRLSGDTIHISLGNFYDEAWLMLRVEGTPTQITGGEITQISDNLYLIKALNQEIVVQIKE